MTPRDDLKPLHLNTQGFRVGKSGEVWQVRDKDKTVQEVRIGEICQVNLFGNVQNFDAGGAVVVRGGRTGYLFLDGRVFLWDRFGEFAGMIKPADKPESPANGFSFDFEGRKRRPPRDPVNALLSLAHSMLAQDLTIAYAVGLDPYIGFHQQLPHGRPALALDLMEPFRPLIADSAVLSTVNTTQEGWRQRGI